MGTACHLIVTGGPEGLLDTLRQRVDELDWRWSRFRPDSELSRLNASPEEFMEVSQDTLTLIRRGIQGWKQTGGVFDPTLLGPLIRAGYDRDFDAVAAGPARGRSDLGAGCGGIVIREGAVRLPAGTGFDSGGLGKGLAADLVALQALRAGATGACINLGGDIRVTGAGPAGGGWTAAVDHPRLSSPLTLVGLADGGMATSTTLLRRWSLDGEQMHHLIDPVTGVPSGGPVEFATVVASEAWLAEVLTKAVMLNQSPEPLTVLRGTGAEGLVVTSDGRVSASGGFGAFIGDSALPERI
ncbi:MAG: FAD:protein FMN transferase [Acidimicrobiales bacterium]